MLWTVEVGRWVLSGMKTRLSTSTSRFSYLRTEQHARRYRHDEIAKYESDGVDIVIEVEIIIELNDPDIRAVITG